MFGFILLKCLISLVTFKFTCKFNIFDNYRILKHPIVQISRILGNFTCFTFFVLYTYIVSYTNPGICNPAKCLIDAQAGQGVAWHVEQLRLTSLFESFYTRLLSILLTMSVNFHKQICANTITY